jgi:hypothetical protein
MNYTPYLIKPRTGGKKRPKIPDLLSLSTPDFVEPDAAKASITASFKPA